MNQAKPPPSISWLTAKQLLFPRVLKTLQVTYGDLPGLEVIDIQGEGFPEPDEAVIQDRTNGWSVYYNNVMKLHPIIRITVDGVKKRIRVPAIINAVLGYDEQSNLWKCIAFHMMRKR